MTSNPPTFAPVPPAAAGPAIPDKGYLRQEIGDGLHLVTDGIYQMMFLATGDGVVAVDAPPALGRFILPAIAEVTSTPAARQAPSSTHRNSRRQPRSDRGRPATAARLSRTQPLAREPVHLRTPPAHADARHRQSQ